MKIIAKSHLSNFTLANLPDSWFQQGNENDISYLGRVSHCENYVVRINKQGIVYVTLKDELNRTHVEVTPVDTLTIESK